MDQPNELNNSSNSVPIEDMLGLYNTQNNRRTLISDCFFSLGNLRQVVAAVEEGLTQKAGFPVQLYTDDWFYIEAAKLVNETANTPDVHMAVSNLNDMVVTDTVRRNYQGIVQRKNFLKNFIYNDRAQHMPYPRDTHGRRRVVPLSAEKYQLGNPDSREWCNFQETMKQTRNTVKTPDLFSIYYE